jgi:hypothetical protein
MTTTDEKAVEVYQAKADELLIKPAESLTITSPEQNVVVTERLAKLKKLGKEIKTEKEKATKPINEALRKVREWWAPLEKAVEDAELKLASSLLVYKRKVEEEARKKEAQIAARVERGTMKLETAERKLDQVQRVEKHTDTSFGRIQFRKVKKVRITDPNLVPDEYWIIDEVALRKAMITEGKQVPGAELYEEESV